MVLVMRRTLLSSLAAGILAFSLPFAAQANEAQFYRDIQGKWQGPGEIVAGKYKGTKFTCNFNGLTASAKTGLSIDGNCRVGMFTQPMNASVERSARGFIGKFLDGEAGEGMDVVGGRYTPSKLIVDIKRKDLRGVMVASLKGEDKLNITISVRVEKQLVPAIGMTLDRVSRVGSDQIVTGTVGAVKR